MTKQQLVVKKKLKMCRHCGLRPKVRGQWFCRQCIAEGRPAQYLSRKKRYRAYLSGDLSYDDSGELPSTDAMWHRVPGHFEANK